MNFLKRALITKEKSVTGGFFELHFRVKAFRKKNSEKL